MARETIDEGLPPRSPANDSTRSADALKDLRIFHNVARALTSSLDRDSILKALMQQMELFFQPESWSLLLADEKKRELTYVVAAGAMLEDLREMRVAFGEGTAGWVAEHGETLIVPSMIDDVRFKALSMDHKAHIRSAICIPLRSRQLTLGVLQIFNCPVETLTDYAISFLHVLCDYAAIAIDNTRAMEDVQKLTLTDDCTGLYNGRHLYATLQAEVERSFRFHRPFSIVFIDLDRFKLINDQYGHLIGSWLLRQVGQRIQSSMRNVDLCFRYGGDEFVVLMPETMKAEAVATALRLLDVIRSKAYRDDGGLHLRISASLGVATFPEDGSRLHEILGAADAAMYAVKNKSRDGVAAAGKGLVAG